LTEFVEFQWWYYLCQHVFILAILRWNSPHLLCSCGFRCH